MWRKLPFGNKKVIMPGKFLIRNEKWHENLPEVRKGGKKR